MSAIRCPLLRNGGQSEVVVPLLGVEFDGLEDAGVFFADQSFQELALRYCVTTGEALQGECRAGVQLGVQSSLPVAVGPGFVPVGPEFGLPLGGCLCHVDASVTA